MLPQHGEKVLLRSSGDGIILALVDGRHNVAVLPADFHTLLDFGGVEIG
jgi:hypothetical protein